MQKKAILVGCYALLIFLGGIVGYIAANSLPSLIASGLFSFVLSICTPLISRGSLKAYDTAILMTLVLAAFFIFRFFLTYKFMPGGVMALVSGILVAYLCLQRKKVIV